MAEFIEREAAINEQKRFCGYLDDDMLNRLEIATRRIPAANVRPVVRGHWRSKFYYRESTNAYDCEMHICSECGSEWSYDAETGLCKFNFCPNCGADMRKES